MPVLSPLLPISTVPQRPPQSPPLARLADQAALLLDQIPMLTVTASTADHQDLQTRQVLLRDTVAVILTDTERPVIMLVNPFHRLVQRLDLNPPLSTRTSSLLHRSPHLQATLLSRPLHLRDLQRILPPVARPFRPLLGLDSMVVPSLPPQLRRQVPVKKVEDKVLKHPLRRRARSLLLLQLHSFLLKRV